MRILHVINCLAMGGAEKLLSEMIPRLCNYGHKVDVLVFDGSSTPFMDDLKAAGVRVITVSSNSSKPYSIINLVKLLSIVHKYDIVHSHTTPAQFFTVLSKYLSFSFKTKIVTTEHSTNNHRRGKWQYIVLDRIMYSLYNYIICISESSKRNLEEQIGKHKNISVIENGIDVEKFHSAEGISRHLLGVDDSDFILTMVGRFVDAKDQDTIIRAMAYLPDDCKLMLVGTGYREKECKALASSLGVGKRVSFLGIRNDIPQILHSSDVILMSSHWEGLSLSSVEGMAVDKPFVASNVVGLREVVGDAGLLFKEGDYKQLASVITRLKNDKKFYQTISERCINRAYCFDISKTVVNYEKLYQYLNNR